MSARLPGKLSIFKSYSFYIRVVTTFLGLLIITVLPIISFNYYKNKQSVLELGDDLMARITKNVIEKTTEYFLPAVLLPEMSARLTELGALSPTNFHQIERYTIGVLKSYPHITMFYLGDKQGDFIRALRLPGNDLEERIINQHISPPTSTLNYWNKEFRLFKTVKSHHIDYDPRIRPWYIGAKKARASYWTSLYIFFSNQEPGITSAYPVIARNGKVVGVWAMDIELKSISSFLHHLKIGQHGVAFIINAKNELVSYPDISKITKEENGALRPLRVDELGINSITTAFRRYLATGQSKLVVTSQGKRYLASFTEFPQSFPARWKVAIVVPENDFIGQAKQIAQQTLLICLVILVAAILLAILVARSISQPIKVLADETRKIKDFYLDDQIVIRSYIKEIQTMSNAIAAMKSGLQAFRKYVPAELVRQLIYTGKETRLGGHKEVLTVFFSDISGFTSIAERLTPEALMLYLSEYFDEITKILSAEHGTVDKYIGDGVMAFWGAPLPDESHAFHACSAALACQAKLRELNQKWESQGKPPLHTRIGISTGETVVGNVGSGERINYTVMGDNVNLASRLEGVNKLYGTNIIVSLATYEAVADKFWFRPLDIVAVKGKTEGTTIYELVGIKGEVVPESIIELCEEFARGFKAYLARDWEGACEIFRHLSEKFPLDAPTNFYLSRCRHYRENPPASDWQGIEYLESK